MLPTMSRQRSKTGNYHILNLWLQLTMWRQRYKTRNYWPRGWIFRCNRQCEGKDTRQGIITLEVECSDATDNVKAKIQDKGLLSSVEPLYANVKAKIQDKGLLSSVEPLYAMENVKAKIQNKELSSVKSSDAINNVKAKIQDKGLSPLGLNLQKPPTMSRQRSKTRDYHPGGWIIGCNWQCQGTDPRQGIITVEVKYSNAIDNVKAKIQDEGLSP